MNKKNIYIYMLIISLGIMSAMMNFLNSLLASNVGLYFSGLIIHIIGLCLSIIIYFLLEKKTNKPWNAIFKENPVTFLGGVIGAISVLLVSFCINKVGIFTTTISMIAGQFLISFLVDKNGWFGFPKRRINLNKKIAVALICFGIILITM